jgi:L-ascorbate metabolism protein UlaG (beta-lactamase superfamily)
LQDVAEVRSTYQVNIWWLGQSGFLVQYGDEHLLLDPYLSDSLSKKYAETNKLHVRLTERVITPEKLDFIDVVTSSHNHTDHLDAETINPLLAVNPQITIIVPRANLSFAADRLSVSPERLTPISVGDRVKVGAFTFRAVPAAHQQIDTDDGGDHKYIGCLVEVAGLTIYHSGDTVLFDGLIGYLDRPIDVAILPINGRDPARGVAGNLSAVEAVQLAQAIGATVLIPCHFDMFAFNTVSPEEFVVLADAAGQPYALLQNGERLTLPRGTILS